ncbi:MAG: hypothetical protein Q8M03_05165, partial [Legionella sp.]|nr:hypothetical protein [Legionella sp.]
KNWKPSGHTFTSIIGGFVETAGEQQQPGLFSLAQQLLERLNSISELVGQYRPTRHLYTALMHGLVQHRQDIHGAQMIFRQMLNDGLVPDGTCVNVLSNYYGQVGNGQAAEELFRKMRQEYGLVPDLISYSTLILAHLRSANNSAAKLSQTEEETSSQLKDEGVVGY